MDRNKVTPDNSATAPWSENDPTMFKRELISLSINGLVNMFDDDKQLFHFKTIRSEKGQLIKVGHSVRYTLITLLGLNKCDSLDAGYPISISKVLRGLLDNITAIDNLGDIGLLLWLTSLASPEKLEEIHARIDTKNILQRYPDGRECCTMELSWLLTGLSYSSLIREEFKEKHEELATKTYRLVRANYGGLGIFGHQGRQSLRGKIRGRMGSFADQVYPIYAFTTYSMAFQVPEALDTALECAKTICRLQGPLGQWWWHYDSVTGTVAGRYPVYSVHQDGMAPMALLLVSEASGSDFDFHINKGLAWITGKNELKCTMVDTSLNVIFRCIYGPKYSMRLEEALSLLCGGKIGTGRMQLQVLYACFPYHLGWLLYAFAGRE